MEKMTNVVISNAERGKSGQASWGSWQAWSVYFVGVEPKFDYFEKDNIVPFTGMSVELVEYEVKQDGQYTNYKIKKMVPAKLTGPNPATVPANTGTSKPMIPVANRFEMDKRLTMCTSYAKDLMIQMLVSGDSSYRDAEFSTIIDLVAKGGRRLAEGLSEKIGLPEPKARSIIPISEKPVAPEAVGKNFANEIIAPAMTTLANDLLGSSPVSGPTGSSTPEVSEPVITSDDVPF